MYGELRQFRREQATTKEDAGSLRDAEVARVDIVAHRLELGDGDVVGLALTAGGDREPSDDSDDEEGAADEKEPAKAATQSPIRNVPARFA
jgi:hypothetical protein